MKGTLFKGLPLDLPEEISETICASDCVKIERIVSRGHASPPGFWYDQEEIEFVLVLQGSAALKIGGESELVVLKRGDYMTIDAHVRHRVEWTDPACDTVWLAVLYQDPCKITRAEDPTPEII